MTSRPAIAIIIPALNEENAIGHVLSALPDWLDPVIVVDNGSTDQTAAVALTHGANVIHEPERGYGAACLTGIAAIKGADIVVFLDADFSDDPNDLQRLITPIVDNHTDLVMGSRTKGNAEQGSLTLAQHLGNHLACFLIRLLWRHAYSDLGPFRAIRRSALEILDMKDRRFGWTVEMQVKALQKGLRVQEVPVNYRCRIGQSKISGTVSGSIKAGATILGVIIYLFCLQFPKSKPSTEKSGHRPGSGAR